MIRETYLDTALTAAALLRQPALAARWREPSALPGFSIGGLARHLANQVTVTPAHLAGAPGAAAVPVLQHYTRSTWVASGIDSDANVGIRSRGEAAAAELTPGTLADEVDAAIETLRQVLPGAPADRVIDLGDWGLTLEDFLHTRVMELVVHGDDLAVSLGVPTPDVPPAATEATIALLARVAAWRHGPLAVVRALARQERAPRTIAAL
ncbi:maleylpyruvate isomerase N-terminal domain-containing protein [Micromonospora sp. DT47]|uniref:maleylpyruvate isomerase N-terminal domain-containing protein n=1 Tax=Micromonospora sp. DT47 TaxID=3393431 RepID=UPI003CF79E8A